MNSYNIIGDVAGQYDALLLLLDQMPEGEPISVGDMIDRGPKSREVVEYFRANGRAVMGNHEHMFINYIKRREGYGYLYPAGCYKMNGGHSTLEQFRDPVSNTIDILAYFVEYIRHMRQQIVIMEPHHYGDEGLIITHAPIHPDPVIRRYFEYTRLWNRSERVERRADFYQLFGHNSHWDQMTFSDNLGEYARCLDTYKHKIVGINWPTMEIFEQEY